MSAARSDAATSTDDPVKGRPLCLFYFAHPFGVLSCEPPTVLAPAPPPAPAPSAPFAPAVPSSATMARRSPTWPARRLPLYTRTLPPLRLPTPRGSSDLQGSEDVWTNNTFVAPDKMSLPPIELPTPTLTPATAGSASETRESRAMRVRRLGPVGVRKGGVRSRGVALVRLLRRAVATSGTGVDCSPRGAVRGALATVRAAWQPPADAPDATGARACSPPRTSCASNPSTIGAGGSVDGARTGDMGPRAPPSPAPGPPGLLHRRYSVPETVMRRYNLAREQSEGDDESLPVTGPVCAPRELVRRSALLRRMGMPAMSPCRCDTRSLGGSRTELTRATRPPKPTLSPLDSLPVVVCNEPRHLQTLPSPDILEIVVSETSPADPLRPARTPTTRSSDCNFNIDEYVSNILVDSLNSLTDRLESMTVSVGGGDGRISVVEKEIKVKLQNKGVNTVVHLSPTSNNQIIFGNRELCERDVLKVPPAPVERLFCDEYQASAESWREPPRTASPCVSLVDSLDDPMSPRAIPPPPPPPPPPLPPPFTEPPDKCESSAPTPLSSAYTESSLQRERCESFFIRMNEDNCACEKENIVVADHMPEKIKQRLYRRHRRREMKAQGVRRGAARRHAQREVQRQCATLVDSLIDDAIAKVAREEYRYARIARNRESLANSEKPRETRMLNGRRSHLKGNLEPRTREELKRLPIEVSEPPSPAARERIPPRRLYHKSEIHDGGKCIEILEIVEYANTSRSSSETNSDESLTTAKGRRSRIPIPIQDKGEQPRVRRATIASSTSLPVSIVTETIAPPRRASVPATEPCMSTSSMRFERVFDVIPEERSSLSLESAGDDVRIPAQSDPPGRRSAATSPHAPPGSASGSVERAPTRRDHEHGWRSIGTQWTRIPLQSKQNSFGHLSDEDSVLPEEQEHSSSQCECDRFKKVQRQPAPARVGTRSRPRVRRRPAHPAHPAHPPLPPTPTDAPPAPPSAKTNLPAAQSTSTTVNSGGDGWSLTLAGSCRAALPSRLDLRLRFPSQGASAAPGEPSSRSDAATDRFSDAGSQDREWATNKRPPVIRGTQAAPAIRYVSTGDSMTVGRDRALRRHKGECDSRDSTASGSRRQQLPHAPPDMLPALGAPPLRRSHCKARDAHCRCWAGGDARVRASAATPPRRPRARSPPSPALGPHLDRRHHAALLATQREAAEIKATATALAVLGCAIVPERRATPPTASQRDLRRARRAAAPRAPRAPLVRRHSVATTASMDTNIRCLCYN